MAPSPYLTRFISLLCIGTLSYAQDSSEPPVEALDDLVIHGYIPLEENILPSSRPFSSVYGRDMSILDTPRNVTIISREQLDAISIQDPRDISKLTTSSYTASNFGAPTTPSIRGQIADTLVNGMRKGLTSNGNGLPLNFNSVESINILKGPPSVMVGVSQYVGGYVDLITKKATFDRNKGALTVTVDSEGMQKAEIDQNFVISDTLAMRVSLQVRIRLIIIGTITNARPLHSTQPSLGSQMRTTASNSTLNTSKPTTPTTGASIGQVTT